MGEGVGDGFQPGQRTLSLEPVAVTPEMEAEAAKSDYPTQDEESMFRNLRLKFPPSQYALLRHVANGTGGSHAYRWADAIAMSLWPSRGLSVSGFEIKVSRSDWLAELKHPEKAEELARYCEYWWLAVPGDKNGIVHQGELPKGWGLLRWKGARWITDRAAALQKAEPVGADFVAAVLRRAQEQMPAEKVLHEEYRRGRKEAFSEANEKEKERREASETIHEELKDAIEFFQKETGIDIRHFAVEEMKATAKLLRQVKERGAPFFRERLGHAANTAVEIARLSLAELAHLDGKVDICPCSEKTWRNLPQSECEDCHGTGYLPKKGVEGAEAPPSG